MPIQSVLSSASSMRLTPPGTPSLIETAGLEIVKLVRLTTVRFPPKYVWPEMVCGCWPTTYMVLESTSALLAPPGMASVFIAVADALAQGAVLHGNSPDCCPGWKIIGETGRIEIEALVPPHSGPQFSTYAVLPSAEKTALTGLSKISGAP